MAAACHGPPERLIANDAAAGRTDASQDVSSVDAPLPEGPPISPRSHRIISGAAQLVGRAQSAALSQSGRYLAATIRVGGKHTLYVIDLDTNIANRLASDLGADPADTAWDGDVLVVGSSNRDDSAGFKGDILLYKPGWTQSQRAVVAVGSSCDVAPGGRAIACLQRQDLQAQTYDVSFGLVDGESETRVALARQYYDEVRSYSFQWTPDGSRYVVSGRADSSSPETISVLAGGSGATLASLGQGSRPRVAPDGTTVAFLAALSATPEGIMMGELRLAPIEGGPARLLASGAVHALFLDTASMIVFDSVRDGRVDLHRLDIRSGASPVIAGGIHALLTMQRDLPRLAVLAGNVLRVIDADGRTLCERRVDPPLAPDVTRFTEGGKSLVFADEAEIFLGAGKGRLLRLDSCETHDLPDLLRFTISTGDDLILATTANTRVGDVYRADPLRGDPQLLQEEATLPFAYSASRRLLLFAIDEGPVPGIYRLSLDGEGADAGVD